MDLLGNDMIIGDFRLSDFGLMLGAFEANNDEEDLGMNYEITEQFIGNNPVPIYLGSKYNSKLRPQATLIKNPNYDKNTYFTEHECREVLRQLTGFRGYKNMQIYINDVDELYNFNVRVQKVSYRRVGGNIIAIVLNMECDSQFAWSKDFKYSYNVSPGKNLVFVNMSDDLNNYLLPKITITSKSSVDKLRIINLTDNNWTTLLNNVSANETITMDSKNQILFSSIPGKKILNDFNLHFIRFISGRNEFSVNEPCNITFEFKVPRKVGFL